MQPPIFSVSELHEVLNSHLALLGELVIEGEISELKPSGTQWLYVTIKDEQSTINIFATQWDIRNWRTLSVGMRVHIYGVARTYSRYGKLSITAHRIEPAGEGALQLAFEKLKTQLESEGLFDPARKRPLPMFPLNIGLITAAQSQAYNDFIKVLQHRMGGLRIYFKPVSVQGDGAPAMICRALQQLNSIHAGTSSLDAIVICRGGGAIEDLHAFNDEAVARAIFASTIPVVCGVGHEGDVTLADLVADVRASTPSNAAELLVREKSAIIAHINSFLDRMANAIRTELIHKKHTASTTMTHLDHTLHATISSARARIDAFYTLPSTLMLRTRNVQDKAMHLQRLLHNLDHATILQKGYSITRSADGKIIRSATSVHIGDELQTSVADGTIYSRATEQPKDSKTPRA